MSSKPKTWTDLAKEIQETARKWGREITITNELPTRSRSKRWQTEQERSIKVAFTWFRHGAGFVNIHLVVKRQETATENLQLIATALEMIRLAEVRGVTDLIMLLYRQMYPAATPPPQRPSEPPRVPAHYAVLHISPDAPLAVCEAAYRALARTAHPDAGGDTGLMQRLNAAIETIRKEKA